MDVRGAQLLRRVPRQGCHCLNAPSLVSVAHEKACMHTHTYTHHAAPPPPQATPPPAPDSGVLGGSLGGTRGALGGARRGYWDPPGGGALGPVLAPKRARIVVAKVVFGDVG